MATAARLSVARRFMARALALARGGYGRTNPNPMVGAVVVRRGRIVGEGYHRRAGQSHAEVEALRRAGRLARGAALYVTLEPCAAHGRTPPCCEAVASSGIAEVVIAERDPNPRTRGRGVRYLRRHGIRVREGMLADEARRLNEVFHTVMTQRRAFVTAKIAQTLDGKIATAAGESRWITGATARAWGHQLRSHVDAILVGVGTIARDNPRLNCRLSSTVALPKRPIKIIVDSRLRTPPSARALSGGAPTWIATTQRPDHEVGAARRRLQRRGAVILTLPSYRGRVDLAALLRELARRGITHVLLEGGGTVLTEALDRRLVDRVYWYVAPMILGGTAILSVSGQGIQRLSQAIRVVDPTVLRFGNDVCISGRLEYKT